MLRAIATGMSSKTQNCHFNLRICLYYPYTWSLSWDLCYTTMLIEFKRINIFQTKYIFSWLYRLMDFLCGSVHTHNMLWSFAPPHQLPLSHPPRSVSQLIGSSMFRCYSYLSPSITYPCTPPPPTLFSSSCLIIVSLLLSYLFFRFHVLEKIF